MWIDVKNIFDRTHGFMFMNHGWRWMSINNAIYVGSEWLLHKEKYGNFNENIASVRN